MADLLTGRCGKAHAPTVGLLGGADGAGGGGGGGFAVDIGVVTVGDVAAATAISRGGSSRSLV